MCGKMINFAPVKKIITAVLVLLLNVNFVVAGAAEAVDSARVEALPRMEISLLTCGPFNNAYSLYGHTAIRFRDYSTGGDWVFNYGVFDFDTPFFVLRFGLGKTDYQLGVEPFARFERKYSRMGCRVNEQVLNLSEREQERLIADLNVNYLPENRVYRYNFYRTNCTTKARDMIEACVRGTITYDSTAYKVQTLREALHDYTAGHPWAEFGDDISLGAGADVAMTFREHQFLPERLMADFDRAVIIRDGVAEPLVKENRQVLRQRRGREDSLPRPTVWFGALTVLSVIIAAIEMRRRTAFKAWDIILITITGIAGCVLLLLFCSEHPTTSTNLQILLLNPLALLFIPTVARGSKLWWKVQSVFIILFLIGSLLQDYAEGMYLLALCLLIRVIMNLIKRKEKR